METLRFRRVEEVEMAIKNNRGLEIRSNPKNRPLNGILSHRLHAN